MYRLMLGSVCIELYRRRNKRGENTGRGTMEEAHAALMPHECLPEKKRHGCWSLSSVLVLDARGAGER